MKFFSHQFLKQDSLSTAPEKFMCHFPKTYGLLKAALFLKGPFVREISFQIASFLIIFTCSQWLSVTQRVTCRVGQNLPPRPRAARWLLCLVQIPISSQRGLRDKRKLHLCGAESGTEVGGRSVSSKTHLDASVAN